MTARNLLEETLAHATRDRRSTTADGAPILPAIDGLRLRPARSLVDDRGALFEVFRTSWGFDDIPVNQVYCTTIRPGVVKGWALHKHHEDRYFPVKGVIQVLLYDVRPDSSTCGKLARNTLSEHDRMLMNIPANVWHADYNPGPDEAILLNMPTVHFDHADPDKYRLPIDTDLIPHDFGTALGW